MTNKKPEEKAREKIDILLEKAGWDIQDMYNLNISASFWVAVREFPLETWHGFADYMLYVEEQAIGVIEAKKEWTTLIWVETQSKKYVEWLPWFLSAYNRPLPFSYETTGIETRFTNHLEIDPKSRDVFAFHTPQRLLEIVKMEKQSITLMQELPKLEIWNLRKVQFEAITNLEESLKKNRRKALIQMATGTGKTFAFCNIAYRLIKYTKAKRILFLVDRWNLARQTLKEFQNFTLPNDGRKFTEVYNIQNMASNKIDDVSKVTISTIQRMYSMLSGKEIEKEDEESSMLTLENMKKEPDPIEYNFDIPIGTFDYIVVDECHRSIYNLWRQILDYFDAKLIGLTATPSAQTIGFFDNNLVMEYNHERAVADGVNVDFNVYKIETQIWKSGSTIKAKFQVDIRDKVTRKIKYKRLDDDLMYSEKELDRSVVAIDQIRTVIRTFKEKIFTEIFPWRKEVPKTLIFAKSDSHAEDIVKIVRDEFGKGNDFCQKITYKTTGKKPEDLIQEFRNSYNPRIAVTVDMIATGTDIRALEIVFFMRTVKSQLLFEQMKGRWVRVIDDNDFMGVTPDAKQKTHFVIVDAVWIIEKDKTDTKSLDKKPMVAFDKILKYISMGSTDPDILSTLVSRLSRVGKSFTTEQNNELKEIWGVDIHELSNNIIQAIDEDNVINTALKENWKVNNKELTDEEIKKVRTKLAIEAVKPLKKPNYRKKLIETKKINEQIIDKISIDNVEFAGFDKRLEEKAKTVLDNFKTFIEENKENLDLIKSYYDQSFRNKISYKEIKEFSKKISEYPSLGDGLNIWKAYRIIKPNKVPENWSSFTNGDYISLLDFTFHKADILEPYKYKVETKFENWIEKKENNWIVFTDLEKEWLEIMKNEFANNISITNDDFAYGVLAQKWGIWAAYEVFGEKINDLIEEMNGVLV